MTRHVYCTRHCTYRSSSLNAASWRRKAVSGPHSPGRPARTLERRCVDGSHSCPATMTSSVYLPDNGGRRVHVHFGYDLWPHRGCLSWLLWKRTRAFNELKKVHQSSVDSEKKYFYGCPERM
ncbi:hypothetical protein BgiBS90_006580 [Biomphalaria glabrata]|nr:hypothetical protein BgiBS90_006580 [Biomphalaria glabrata]